MSNIAAWVFQPWSAANDPSPCSSHDLKFRGRTVFSRVSFLKPMSAPAKMREKTQVRVICDGSANSCAVRLRATSGADAPGTR